MLVAEGQPGAQLFAGRTVLLAREVKHAEIVQGQGFADDVAQAARCTLQENRSAAS
jgi:hypothetical protein